MLVEHLKDWQRYDFGTEWQGVMRWLEAAWLQTQRASGLAAGDAGSLLDLSPGAHTVGGSTVNVLATTSRLYNAADGQGCRYEVHRRFCDVQMVLEGQEWLFTTPAQGSLDGPFDADKDVGFYAPAQLTETARLTLQPGLFALLFPWDAHLPAMAVDNTPAPLHKCVAKIPLDALRLC